MPPSSFSGMGSGEFLAISNLPQGVREGGESKVTPGFGGWATDIPKILPPETKLCELSQALSSHGPVCSCQMRGWDQRTAVPPALVHSHRGWEWPSQETNDLSAQGCSPNLTWGPESKAGGLDLRGTPKLSAISQYPASTSRPGSDMPLPATMGLTRARAPPWSGKRWKCPAG